MATILEKAGFRFFFFLSEPKYKVPHIHVVKGKMEAIFWLEPEVFLQKNNKHFTKRELAKAEKIVLKYQQKFLDKYYEKINPKHK